MTQALSRRLKQAHFTSPQQEALLSLAVAAGTLNDLIDEICKRHGLTRPQYNVLRILRGVHPQGHPRCEVAQRMVERAPDITRLVDRLQARGLVRRTRGGDDQRQAITHITAKGLKLLQAMQPELEIETTARLQKLSDKDCHELSRLCAVIFEDSLPGPGKCQDSH
jgi:DNA-binding MarR family transcriptional regulator